MRRKAIMAGLVLALAAAAGPSAAAPNDDGQPAGAPSRYSPSPTGWMTSAAADRVHDFAQIGNTVYVAGAFAGIRPTRTGAVTNRAWLAAFDAVTGQPRAGFAPVLNGAVYSLEPAPDGSRLYVAGAFTTVNGSARNRLVALNPATGAIVPGFTPNVGGGSVRSITLAGTTLYAGGNFASASGQTRGQLAAFDTATGQPFAGWTPNATGGAVLTLEQPPGGGRVYVGGRFTAVNGQPSSAFLAALDPVTGQTQPTFAAQPGREVFDLLADAVSRVWAALGGALGRADVYQAANGSLITRHETAGDVESVEQIGDLVYFGGHDIGLSEFEHVGVVDPAAPAILETAPFDEPSTGGDGIWALHSTGQDLWVGGNVSGPYFGFARHAAVPDPPARTELLPVLSTWRYLDTAAAPAGWRTPAFNDSAWPTGPAELGFGDTGEITTLASGRTSYYFRRTFPVADLGTLTDLRLDLLVDDGAAVYVNGTEVVRTNLPTGTLTDTSQAPLGISGNLEDTFTSFSVPATALVEGSNTIAVEVHQNAAASSDVSFDARLSAVRDVAPPVDTQPPSVPSGLVADPVTATSAGLAWQPATDDVGVDHYDVFRDGALAGAPTASSFGLTGLTPATSYSVEVEAVDAAGNRSGRSAPLTVTTTPPAPGPVEVVPRGAVWRYRNVGAAPPATWTAPRFDDSTWSQGPAILGREEGGEGTVLTSGSGVRWFRRSFSLPDADLVSEARLSLVADDAALVFLNGTEVVRDNLPAGTVTPSTLAATYRTGTDERAVRTFTVPPSALVDGVNVLAVQLHQASGSTDASFDASLTLTGATADLSPPTLPTGLTSPSQTSTSVVLAWAASSDDVGVERYEVVVDGVAAGSTAGTGFTATGLAPASTHTFAVEALDAAGNRSGRSAAITVTTTAPPPGPVELIARGATWRYRNVGAAPPANWTQVGFDDATWLQGPAQLGREEGDEATVLTAGSGVRWFRRTFTTAGAGAVSSLVVDLLVDDGAAVYLNGVELLRDNLPAGTLTTATLATDYVSGSAEGVRHTYTVPASALLSGTNVLAVQLHQASGSTDASFDLRLTTR